MLYYDKVPNNILVLREKEISVIEFIDLFKEYENNDVLVNTFTQGFCYWFAFILKTRFKDSEIYYNTEDHFMIKLNDKLYDITGDCTDNWNNNCLYLWNDFIIKYPNESKCIIRDVIEKKNTKF